MKTICIMCPMGCPLDVEKKDGKIVVTGNTCPRGKQYGEQELVKPVRVVTTLIRLTSGGVVSVKTDKPVDKHLIKKVLAESAEITLTPPLKIGDTVITDVADSGANLIVTSDVK